MGKIRLNSCIMKKVIIAGGLLQLVLPGSRQVAAEGVWPTKLRLSAGVAYPMWGWSAPSYWFSRQQEDRSPPFYALYPPVYYDGIVARPYGAFPFAWIWRGDIELETRWMGLPDRSSCYRGEGWWRNLSFNSPTVESAQRQKSKTVSGPLLVRNPYFHATNNKDPSRVPPESGKAGSQQEKVYCLEEQPGQFPLALRIQNPHFSQNRASQIQPASARESAKTPR